MSIKEDSAQGQSEVKFEQDQPANGLFALPVESDHESDKEKSSSFRAVKEEKE